MLMSFDSERFEGARAGRKASNLQALWAAGFPVPAGFVVPPDLKMTALRGDGHLARAIESIGGYPVGVRSSAFLEDLEDASFAGLYRTHLNVAGPTQLEDAILDCRASGCSPVVRAYLERKGLGEGEGQVSILVQPMVSASHAGVGFTLHPLTGHEEHALVEICQGVGERLVSGRITPSRYVLSLRDGHVIEHVAGDDALEPEPRVLREIAALLLRIQAHFGQPQDAEFAVDADGKVWILQARPITRFEPRREPEEWTNADFRDGGVSARVCTPLMFSLYRNAMQDSLQGFFETLRLLPRGRPRQRWIAMFYGRPYWNATASKACLARVPGFDEQVFDRDLGVQKAYGPAGPRRTPTTPRTVLAVIPAAVAAPLLYSRQLARVRAFGAPFLQRERRTREELADLGRTNDATFFRRAVEVFDRFHRETESEYFSTIYANTTIQSDFKKLVAAIDKLIGGVTNVLDLMSGLDTIAHVEIQRQIFALHVLARRTGFDSAEWRSRLAAAVQQLYYHADAELDLACPRWGEVPERIESMVRDIVAGSAAPVDPDETRRRQIAAYKQARDDVLRRLRRSWIARLRYERAFHSQLGRMRAYLSAREQMRDYSVRCYAIVRAYALEAGCRLSASGVLEHPDDIFMLHTEDLVALCRGPRTAEGTTALRAEIAHRRALYRGYRNFTPPNELGGGIEMVRHAARRIDREGNVVLQGNGCSSGVVTGRARAIRSVERIGQLAKGEILVARFTDPGWTPVLGIAAGVVTEVGGLLSHAAVISRELGIPAVLDVPAATSLLDERMVTVDGMAGTVTVHGTPP